MKSAAKLTAGAIGLTALASATSSVHAARGDRAPSDATVRASAADVSAPSLRPRDTGPGPGRPGYLGFSIRLGGSWVALRAEDLPMAGDDLAAFARVTGNDVSQVDFRERLATVAPSLHVGGSGYFFRVDAPIGISSSTKTFGVGVYPLNVGVPIRAARLMPYAGAGVIGSLVVADTARGTTTGTGGSSATGGLFQARTALGVKLLPGRRADLSLEVGYSPWAVGGVLNATELDRATAMFESGARVREPSRVLRAGAGAVWDLSLGIGWL